MTTKLGRPPLPEGARRVRVDFRLDPKTIEYLDKYAERLHLTRTKALEVLVQSGTKWIREKEEREADKERKRRK